MLSLIYKSDTTAIGDTNPLPVEMNYGPNSFNAIVNYNNALTAQTIKSATSGKSIYVTDLVISTQQATTFTLLDGDGTVLIPYFYLAATTTTPIKLSTPIKVAASKDLMFKTGSQVNITVMANGKII